MTATTRGLISTVVEVGFKVDWLIRKDVKELGSGVKFMVAEAKEAIGAASSDMMVELGDLAVIVLLEVWCISSKYREASMLSPKLTALNK